MNLLNINHITRCFGFSLRHHQVIHILLRQITELHLCTANTFIITVIVLIIYRRYYLWLYKMLTVKIVKITIYRHIYIYKWYKKMVYKINNIAVKLEVFQELLFRI
jgi:hypothetical protein